MGGRARTLHLKALRKQWQIITLQIVSPSLLCGCISKLFQHTLSTASTIRCFSLRLNNSLVKYRLATGSLVRVELDWLDFTFQSSGSWFGWFYGPLGLPISPRPATHQTWIHHYPDGPSHWTFGPHLDSFHALLMGSTSTFRE